MNWPKLKWLAVDLAAVAVSRWYLIAAAAVVVLVLFWADSCRQTGRERKLDRIGANIAEKQAESRVLANQAGEIQETIDNAEANSSNLRDDLDRSRARDSREFPSAAAERKFCERFPLDSSCRAYCAAYGCP